MGRNPVCLRGHMLVEMVPTVWKFIRGTNSSLIIIPGQCLQLNTGEETGYCKMIIEKEVGGPLWTIYPLGTVILNVRHVSLPEDYETSQIVFEEIVISF